MLVNDELQYLASYASGQGAVGWPRIGEVTNRARLWEVRLAGLADAARRARGAAAGGSVSPSEVAGQRYPALARLVRRSWVYPTVTES